MSLDGTMVDILRGLGVIGGSAFVAAPLAGLTLAQLGADVIGFDRLRGGLDHHRWPVTRARAIVRARIRPSVSFTPAKGPSIARAEPMRRVLVQAAVARAFSLAWVPAWHADRVGHQVPARRQ